MNANKPHIASTTKNQKDPRIDKLEKELYTKSVDTKLVEKMNDRVDKEIRQAKFNYRMMRRKKHQERMRFVGSLKHKNKFMGSMQKCHDEDWFSEED